MATFKPVIFTTKNHIKQDGTTNIKIRIYHNQESQYIPTNYYIEPQYMGDNGEVMQSYLQADILNYQISEIIQKYRKSHIQIGNSANRMSCSELKEYLSRSDQSDFIDFVEASNGIILKTKKQKTAEWYTTSINVLKWYWGREKININDITAQRLTDFIKRLSEEGPSRRGLEPGAISNYVRGIRALFNKCKSQFNNEDFGVIPIPHDPFKRIIIPQYKKKRKNISIDKVKIIRDFQAETEREEIGRDMFMIMFYLMGINVNDLYSIKTIISGRIEYERNKTNTDRNEDQFPLSIRIEQEAKELIDKYSDKQFLSAIHKRYGNTYNFMKSVNKGLKSICEKTGMQKVTTNWARHSWASIARNVAKIPKADVDFCLGHVTNDYRMADIYIDIDYSICDHANRKVIDLLK